MSLSDVCADYKYLGVIYYTSISMFDLYEITLNGAPEFPEISEVCYIILLSWI